MRTGDCNASGNTRYRPFVSEDEVGITEFSNPDRGGVGGRLKLLPEDFIVEELPSEPPAPSDPSAQPGFLEFTLHKTRLGTLQALTALAAELGVPPSTFTVAGLKDSHALTTQRVSCRCALLDEAAIRAAVDSLARLAVEGAPHTHTHSLSLFLSLSLSLSLSLTHTHTRTRARARTHTITPSSFVSHANLTSPCIPQTSSSSTSP